jgi:hypothetical protein
MRTGGNPAAIAWVDVNGLAEEYQAALMASDLPRAEEVASTLWERYLSGQALERARECWREFDQYADQRTFTALGRERFIAELTSQRRVSRTLADVRGHIEDAFRRATENAVLRQLASRCQHAAAEQDEPHYQQCFWAFCAIIWDHVAHKARRYPQYQMLESEILDEVERRLRSKLRQPEPIEHIFGFIDVVIARAASSVIRHHMVRRPGMAPSRDSGLQRALPEQERLLELQQLWDRIEHWVADIDRAEGDTKGYSLIYHLDLARRTQAEIAQSFTPPISQGEVSKRMSHLCRQLAARILPLVGQQSELPGRLPHGWCYQMIEALREMKENLEGKE